MTHLSEDSDLIGKGGEGAKVALLALAERVEALTGPSREVDLEIYNSPFPPSLHFRLTANTPAFTASLDAAMTLVPEGGFAEINTYDNPDCFVWPAGGQEDCLQGTAATPALALCAAALRARAAA